MSVNNRKNTAYTIGQPLSGIFPDPIVSQRAPTVNDKAFPGQVWSDVATNQVYILASVVANVATWINVAAGGGAGVFANLTVNPGPTNLTGALTVTSGANAVNIGSDNAAGAINIGVNGARQIDIGSGAAAGFSIQAGGVSNLATANANLTIVSGTGDLDIATDAGNQNVNIATGTGVAGVKTVTIGSITGTSPMFLQVGTGTAHLADNATDHSTVVGSTAGVSTLTLQAGTGFVRTTQPIRLQNLVNIQAGAGAPANGLALETGDLYINTTAATAATRVYVATGAGAWTNLVAAA